MLMKSRLEVYQDSIRIYNNEYRTCFLAKSAYYTMFSNKERLFHRAVILIENRLRYEKKENKVRFRTLFYN
jgi:hypothetical protein